ncbi:hypothetical protein Nocox_39685 [Nonomuraea coxensis DSM 45129]|uniref:Uncharacterized protein n=1 Tax=Nonomuraea coxensis DSM 45129 TaxID=1122611 RepID=A0ABX8UD17_9ACTN|nr:hypothetical protein [Nonomuraea coxensis]QYC45480.1 hypothetical protein Nocox_39685 [Nonomuraea coxensis DSM 45129]
MECGCDLDPDSYWRGFRSGNDPSLFFPSPHGAHIKGPGDFPFPIKTYNEIYPSGRGIIADLDENGIVTMAVEKADDTPRGSEMFGNAMKYFGGDVKGVKAYWQNGDKLRDNLDSFNAAIRSGMSLDDAARATFTGKMAGRHGFTRSVEFVELRGNHGEYTNVGVIFR